MVRVHVTSPDEQRRGGMTQQIKQQRRYSGPVPTFLPPGDNCMQNQQASHTIEAGIRGEIKALPTQME